ncbi:hypothetical protein D3C86_1333400 [compost metagenome]
MLGALEEGVDVGVLDDLAGVHDGHVVAHLGDDPQVVGDQHDGGTPLGADVAHQIEDLGLDGHVEGGGGLVGDEQLGLAREGHGDDDALAHAARELVGVVVHAAGGPGDADGFEHLDGALAGGGAVDLLVEHDGFHDLLADREDGVERGHGVLRDQGDAVAADLAHLGLGEREQVLALEEDLAADDLALGACDEAHDREGGDALAAAGFADDAEDLARLDLEVDAVHRLDDAFLGGEVGLQPGNLEQRFCHVSSIRPGWAGARAIAFENGPRGRAMFNSLNVSQGRYLVHAAS